MNKSVLIVIVAAVVFAGAGFYAGVLYGSSKNSVAISSGAANRPSGAGNTLSGAAGGVAYGEIVSVDTSSMTVKASNGSSKIVFFSDSAKITKNTEAQASDFAVGETVMAFGSTNSDGSINAKTIEINPQVRANSQSEKTNSGNTYNAATQAQSSNSKTGDTEEIPPMDYNGAGGPPPGM